MAYIMKGYTYPGESPVKAKKQLESVSNPDKTLIAAGKALGSSYIPMTIDYSVKTSGIDVNKDDDKDKSGIDKSGADRGSESRSNYNKKKAKKGKKANKEKDRGGEDIPQDWSDPNIA